MIDHPLRAVSFRAARSASSSLGRLRDVLAQAGYDGVEQTVTDHGELTLAEGLATLRLRPDADERLLVLARLFLAGETVAQEQAASALRPVSLAELPGLVSGDGGLRPFADAGARLPTTPARAWAVRLASASRSASSSELVQCGCLRPPLCIPLE